MTTRIIEIRTYKLRPGSRGEFHRLVHEQSIPMVRDWGHEVLAYGPAIDDPDGYVLIRAYDSIEELHAKQDAFYGSDAWKLGPREAIVSLIEADSSAIFSFNQ